jgi:hypothetical protein
MHSNGPATLAAEVSRAKRSPRCELRRGASMRLDIVHCGPMSKAEPHSRHRAIRLRADATACSAMPSFDPDSFKCVDASLGHGAGDTLLRQIAARLRASLAPTTWPPDSAATSSQFYAKGSTIATTLPREPNGSSRGRSSGWPSIA